MDGLIFLDTETTGNDLLQDRLYKKVLEKIPDPKKASAWKRYQSSKPLLFKTFNFGKYKGRKIEEIVVLDKRYVQWLLDEKMKNGAAEDDWIYTLKNYLTI